MSASIPDPKTPAALKVERDPIFRAFKYRYEKALEIDEKLQEIWISIDQKTDPENYNMMQAQCVDNALQADILKEAMRSRIRQLNGLE